MPAGRFTVPAVLDQRADECGDRIMMSIDGTHQSSKSVSSIATARTYPRGGQLLADSERKFVIVSGSEPSLGGEICRWWLPGWC
jgi:hypothetical protein